MTEIKRRWALYAHTNTGDASLQFQTLRDWAQKLGAEITHEIIDWGQDTDGRDEALDLLAYGRVEAVAVYHLTDLGRQVSDLGGWLRSVEETTGTVLVWLENMDLSDPQTQGMLKVMTAFAAKEEQHLAEHAEE